MTASPMQRSCSWRLRLLSLGLIALGLAGLGESRPACAQELGLLSAEAGLPVALDGAQPLQGLTPLSLSNGAAYTRLRVGGRGFEYRQARLGWDAQGRPVLTNDAGRRAFLGILLPGAGSMLSGRRLHGAVELGSAAYLGLGIVAAADDRDAALADYDRWRHLAEDANDPTAYEWEAKLALAEYGEYENHRDRQLRVAGAFLGIGAIEAWWFNRPLEAQVRAHQLGLQVPRLSRAKAVIASMILPGMGQAYRQQWRSSVYLAGEVFLIQELLDTYRRRNLHELRLEQTRSFLAADGLDGAEAEQLQRLESRLQGADDDLHRFAALAGGLWLVNTMDALLSRPEGSRPRGRVPRLSLLTAPGGDLGLGLSARF
jgi:hypothetical protein